MRTFALSRFAFSLTAAALLAACGGSQPTLGAPVTMPQNSVDSAGYKSLYSFGAGSDGQQPKAGLIDVNGTLYGTTHEGGSNGDGTVFSISTKDAENVLHSFQPYTGDGLNPSAGLIAAGGLLYGTTDYGGDEYSQGTVFRISTSGAENIVHRFLGFPHDGANPVASLIDVKGKLYGTTVEGGSDELYGTVFRVATTGEEKVLHSFTESFYDGGRPVASLLNVNGTLYGTTDGGQACSCVGGGTIFNITRTGSEKVLYAFNLYANPEGTSPIAALIDVKGLLYGTAAGNGLNGGGTAFSITTSGNLSAGVIGIATWRVYRMWKRMAYHYRRYRHYRF